MSGKNYGTPYTESQRQVIEYRGRDMLVSASAGTGKTTVMIERIAELLENGADISEIVVVTFTNLAAAEMKNRLAAKLAAKRDKRIIEQLERIDSANICTLHSFCGELLRNYFYVVDIDPAYSILDQNLISNLRQAAMDEVFERYFDENDETFKQTYAIFATQRKQSNFYGVLFGLYEFSRCIPDFNGWYQEKRGNLLNLGEDGAVIKVLFDDIRRNVPYYAEALKQLAQTAFTNKVPFADVIQANADKLSAIRLDSCEHALYDLYKLTFDKLPDRPRGKKASMRTDEEKMLEENVRANFDEIVKDYSKFAKKYVNLSRGLNLETLRSQTAQTTELLDKLVEIINRFEKNYFEKKKERGGVDFNDLEHFALQILNDAEAYQSIQSKCKYVFVDEYQDTNPVQEAIISKLAAKDNLFMVGDVKQSIYGFRGCEPNIFADKEKRFELSGCGKVIRLNDNFRSNGEILNFVNAVFNGIMTEDFGRVDYAKDAQLRGVNAPTLTQTPSVRVDFVTPTQDKEEQEITDVYDITAETDDVKTDREAALVVHRIKQYVGMRYVDNNGNERVLEYGDIVILLRTFKDKAVSLYNALISANIPVVANFNLDGYASKEIRELINLFRVLDNPYNDVYLVGVCLSCLGGFTESELGLARLNNPERMPFYDRLKEYAQNGADKTVADKIVKLLNLLETLRFYSRSASVSEVALETIRLTDYHLYVQGLPNSGLRLRKMYNFIDSVKDAVYAQSIESFLSYIDAAEENQLSDGVGAGNAVRMMTMHASKGLEFPVVIICDMQHLFRQNDGALECNFDMGVAMNYYDFTTMTYAPTPASTAFGMRNVIKTNEEQMRLLYVAMTRAKYALNLVATATERQINGLPKQPQNASSHLDWLLYALYNFDGAKSVKPEINVFTEISDDLQAAGNTVKLINQEEDAQSVLDKLSYVYPYREQRDMPGKVVSSALDKEYIGVHEQAEFTLNQDDDRNYVGTAYHKVYQYVDYNADTEQIKQTIEALVADGAIERRFADKLDVNLIYGTLRNPQLRQIMSIGRVYHEMPFMLYAPYNRLSDSVKYSDEIMLQGVIDLLVIGKDKAAVVDFKYTSDSSRVKDNYAAQLNSYKLAVKQICGIQNVDCYVLSIADNKLIKF